MPYKVTRGFKDKNTQIHYRQGVFYPGGSVSDERLKELMSEDNAVKTPVLEKVKEVPRTKEESPEEEKQPQENEFPKHKGGPWYELSNGEKIQGKEEAVQAEEELK
ncbi:hypothetical protein VKA52_12710 [Halobacillus sp. HZG1]|uniref:hypothetical protein n=1 Tax=Halobacillus sp. HZG1 TaxID=3111769 RepID=UPI002DB7FF0D|nr:hypothetical protein [Halobacillus sp. HZG1]MEC3884587.1 hypothetical protein [Halobacillus sp. HZG1]